MSKKNYLNDLFTIMMVTIMSFVFYSCSSDDGQDDGSSNTTDVAVTSNVSKLGITYAHIDGYVNLNLITSSYTSQQIGVELSTNENFNNARQARSKNLEGNKFTVVIDTFSAASRYYYRTYVKVNDLNYYGEKRSFTTKDFSNITSTGDASSLTYTSARINCKADAGSIDSENRISIGVAYSTKKNQLHADSIRYIKSINCSLDNVKNNSYEVSVSNLLTGTTYYYCSYTRAGNKYKLGEIKSFTTKNVSASELSTSDASDITFTSATLKGSSSIASLYPKGTSISYGFRYSTTKESLDESNIPEGFVYYGHDNNGYLYYNSYTGEQKYLKFGPYQTVRATIEEKTITSYLNGLISGETYYYCAYASVDGIILTSEVRSFTTKSGNSYISTENATDVTLTSAKLNGKTTLSSLYPNNESNIRYYIRYSKNTNNINDPNNYGNYETVTPNKEGNNLSATLKNLQTNTTCYYCVAAYVDGYYICGDVKSFTTKSSADYLKTENVSDITMTSATLKGSTTLSSIYPSSTSIQYSMRYATSSNSLTSSYNSSSITVTKNGNVLTGTATNLKSGTTYYYCVVAYVDGIYVYGETKSFTTKSGTDYLKAGEASNITMTSATVKGTTTLETIYNNGSAIQYWILYGTTSNLTSSSSSATPELNESTLTAELANLTMATTYYFCILAYVDGSYVYSDTKSFTTMDIQRTGSVDLGVSCKWAACNLGATTPESYGDYYAWGETETRTFFYTTNYSLYNKNIGTDISGTDYDAARKILGSPWRMPTLAEYQELLTKCFWKEITYKNTLGYLVTGKNGNAIFLPGAGYKSDNAYKSGYYIWTSTYYNNSEQTFAYCWHGSIMSNTRRHYGLTIRPVE